MCLSTRMKTKEPSIDQKTSLDFIEQKNTAKMSDWVTQKKRKFVVKSLVEEMWINKDFSNEMVIGINNTFFIKLFWISLSKINK